MAKPIKMRQVQLEFQAEYGMVSLTTYVDDRPDLKVGCKITMKDYKDPKRRWKVVGVGEQVRNKSDIKTTWNNNI